MKFTKIVINQFFTMCCARLYHSFQSNTTCIRFPINRLISGLRRAGEPNVETVCIVTDSGGMEILLGVNFASGHRGLRPPGRIGRLSRPNPTANLASVNKRDQPRVSNLCCHFPMEATNQILCRRASFCLNNAQTDDIECFVEAAPGGRRKMRAMHANTQ